MNLKLKYCLIYLGQVTIPSVVLLGAPYIGLVPRNHRSRIVEIVAGLALIVVLALMNWAFYRHERRMRLISRLRAVGRMRAEVRW